MSWSWIRLCALLLVAAVAGCGPLPRAFEPGGKDLANPLLQLKDSTGVVVAPVYDAPAEIAAPLAETVADALRRQDIPATASGVLQSGNLLESWYRLENPAEDAVDIVVDWRLSDRTGAEFWQGSSRLRMGVTEPGREVEPLLKKIAADIVPRLAAAMIGERQSVTRTDKSPLVVGEIAGAPGDGDQALRWALRSVLRRVDVPVTENVDEAAAFLDGVIEVTSHSETQERVRLVWTIRDSGRNELAILRQENLIPKGRLQGRWGSMAFDVALAMRAEIVETMRRLGGPAPGGLAVPPGLR